MKTTHTTLTRAARIAAALAADNETTTEQARVYLTNQIECIGEGETFADKLEDFASIENHRDDAFGVNVMEDVDGDPYLVFGNIEYETDANSVWTDINTLLEIIESADEVPDWWDDGWTTVDCPDGPGYTTKQWLVVA